MPELAKYHTFNTVIIGAGVALRWRGDTGASPFPPVALLKDGRKNKCTPGLRLSCLVVRLVGHCVGSTTLALERIACSSSTAALRRLSGSTLFRASAPENRLSASRLISPVILSLSALSVWMNST